MAKIIGGTTSTPMRVPDWNQTDPNRADYIKNKPKDYELIASGELIEAVNGINISVDNDGNPLSLRDVITIYVYCPTAAQTANITVNINGLVSGTIQSGVNNGGDRYSRALCVYSGKRWDTYAQTANGTSAANNITSLNNHNTTHDSIATSIKLFLYTASQVLPVGFKYEIYGRRA